MLTSLAALKTISIVLLVVVVALAGASPVFAYDGLEINPASACQGTEVVVYFSDAMGSLNTIVISSDPDGLSIQFDPKTDCHKAPYRCEFVVDESASCGQYTVTLTNYKGDQARIIGSILFEVPSKCCAGPVGGCVQPVNTFGLIAPWFAVVGLVGCIGTAVLVAKKRRQ